MQATSTYERRTTAKDSVRGSLPASTLLVRAPLLRPMNVLDHPTRLLLARYQRVLRCLKNSVFRRFGPSDDCVEVLISYDGLSNGTRYFFADAVLLFGRGARCRVRIESVDVSRNHCLIERKGREIVLVDTNSTNGVKRRRYSLATELQMRSLLAHSPTGCATKASMSSSFPIVRKTTSVSRSFP